MKRGMPIHLTAIALIVETLAPAGAHPIKKVTIKTICHFEENYYVWTANEPWKVWGRVKPIHANKKVVLQRSKYGNKWKTWKVNNTNQEGRYRFKGTAPDKGPGWWVNLRVRYRAQKGHKAKISLSIYVDENPDLSC
jgi:hypothetical protein